jgi:arylsulfatase
VSSTVDVPVGPSTLGVRFRRDGDGAVATLQIDGVVVGEMQVPFAMRMISSVGASVGYDHGSPVSEQYADEFPFEGDLVAVEIELVPSRPAESREQAETDERATMGRQ